MKTKLQKAFSFVELIVVMSIMMITLYIWRDVFAQKSMEGYLKEEADKIKFLVYQYILDPNVGYISGASLSCGNLSFNNVSAQRIKSCIGGAISDRFFMVNDLCPDNTKGACSYFSSDRVIPFKIFIDEDSANTDKLYLYVKINTDVGVNISAKDAAFFEQTMYGYLANAFSPILLNEYNNCNWDETSPNTTNISTIKSSNVNIYQTDGMFMLELKKI